MPLLFARKRFKVESNFDLAAGSDALFRRIVDSGLEPEAQEVREALTGLTGEPASVAGVLNKPTL
jgi:hypothetical protein